MSLKDAEANPEPIEVAPGVFREAEALVMGPPSSWRVTQPICPKGSHNLVDDPSEKDFEAKKCTNCPYGVLVRRKT